MGYEIVHPEQGCDVFDKDFGDKPIVYLGGNSRGRDWRIDFLRRFNKENVLFINPRRDTYVHPEDMPSEHAEQVLWERSGVNKSDITVFWLGEGLANQAARVEIGYALGLGKHVIIGAEAGFLGLEHLSAFSGLVLSTSVEGLMDRMAAALREIRK